jgi:hypothetical protein
MVGTIDTAEMSPDSGSTSDAFAAAVARHELAAASERRAHSAAASGEGMTNIEAARCIACVLLKAAEKLGIPEGLSLDELLERILTGAHRGGLDPLSYRIIWTLARPPKRDESAAS